MLTRYISLYRPALEDVHLSVKCESFRPRIRFDIRAAAATNLKHLTLPMVVLDPRSHSMYYSAGQILNRLPPSLETLRIFGDPPENAETKSEWMVALTGFLIEVAKFRSSALPNLRYVAVNRVARIKPANFSWHGDIPIAELGLSELQTIFKSQGVEFACELNHTLGSER